MSLSSQEFKRLALDEIDAVYRMAMYLAHDPNEAEELVQETYLRALRFEHTFELRDHGIRPWLFRILHNCFYTRIGRQRKQPTLAEDLQSESVPSELDNPPPAWDLASLDWEQVDDRLKHAIDDLKDPYRSVLLLWAVENLKYREIAELLEIPIGTVMSRLYRARNILSEQLADLARDRNITVTES